ncbi:MAG: SDR family NAD(P)-dependent oxidoreductase [Parvibaculales bacterium]
MSRLENKIALVTGGASRPGLGSAIADRFGEEGAIVYLTDIDVAGVEKVAGEINARGGQAIALEQDVSQESRWEEIFAQIKAEQGRVDVVVNNAGISLLGTIETQTTSDYMKVMDINMHGVFYGTKLGVALMRETGTQGSIINMSSIVGQVGVPGTVGYAATKGGVKMMSKTVALETAKEKIRVNTLHPGMIMTNIQKKAIEENPEFYDAYVAGIPMGEFGEPEDIANAALFLASDESRYITGAELTIDGGITAG